MSLCLPAHPCCIHVRESERERVCKAVGLIHKSTIIVCILSPIHSRKVFFLFSTTPLNETLAHCGDHYIVFLLFFNFLFIFSLFPALLFENFFSYGGK